MAPSDFAFMCIPSSMGVSFPSNLHNPTDTFTFSRVGATFMHVKKFSSLAIRGGVAKFPIVRLALIANL